MTEFAAIQGQPTHPLAHWLPLVEEVVVVVGTVEESPKAVTQLVPAGQYLPRCGDV
jgi:hypothetical protein